MIRALPDTNVLISALFWGGLPRRVVDLAVAGRFQAITSPELINEFEEVLAEDFHLPQELLDLILRDTISYCEVVTPEAEVEAPIRDQADVKVLSCAISGRADFIITGDNDLLALKELRAIRIVTVREFLETHACLEEEAF